MDDEEAFGRGFSVGTFTLCPLSEHILTESVVQQTFGIEVDFAGQSLTVSSPSLPLGQTDICV